MQVHAFNHLSSEHPSSGHTEPRVTESLGLGSHLLISLRTLAMWLAAWGRENEGGKALGQDVQGN